VEPQNCHDLGNDNQPRTRKLGVLHFHHLTSKPKTETEPDYSSTSYADTARHQRQRQQTAEANKHTHADP